MGCQQGLDGRLARERSENAETEGDGTTTATAGTETTTPAPEASSDSDTGSGGGEGEGGGVVTGSQWLQWGGVERGGGGGVKSHTLTPDDQRYTGLSPNVAN